MFCCCPFVLHFGSLCYFGSCLVGCRNVSQKSTPTKFDKLYKKIKHPGYKININRFAIIYIAMYLLSIVCVGIFYFVFDQT
jgi:hypothetical protein